MLPHDARAPLEQNPWKRFRNDSGETIPPFSVLRITGGTNNYGEITITVAKPNATLYQFYMVNGPFAVADGEEGICTTLTQAGYVAYNSGSGTPSVAEEWGPKSGQWTVEKNYPGFWIVGGIKITAGLSAVVAIQSEESPGLVRFELTATLALSGDAAAILLEDDGGDWSDTANEIQVYDLHTTEGMWNGITGYRGWATRIQGSHASGRPRYGIVWMERIAQIIQFTSTEYMGDTTANQMAATVNWFDHQGKDPGSSVIVRDPQGQFPDIHSGAKGTAEYDNHNGYYRVISSQRVALFASASLSADSCGSSMSVSSFSARATGDYVGSPPTAPTSVTNSCAHAGLSGDSVLLRRTNNSMPEPGWEVVDVSKHAKDVIVDVQVTGLTLQKKTIAIYAEVCTTTAPSWETWHTGDECA